MNWLGLAAVSAIGITMLIVLLRYMRRSRVRYVEISALAFLPALSVAQQSRVRWQFAQPLQSPLFWLRLGFLGLLLSVFFVDDYGLEGEGKTALGVLIVVDHSASMGVGAPDRLSLAIAQAQRLENHVSALAGCSRIASVPQSAVETKGTMPVSRHGLASNLLVATSYQLAHSARGCDWTHLVVISDMPKPPASLLNANDETALALLWFQVGTPEFNRAISGATFTPASMKGDSARLDVTLADFGAVEGALSLALFDPDGQAVDPLHTVDLSLSGDKRIAFPVAKPGLYHAQLGELGGVDIDNRLAISIDAIATLPIHVGPNLTGSAIERLATTIAQQRTTENPEKGMQVALFGSEQSLQERGIYLVPGFSSPFSALGYFEQSNPLLALVDLDLLEAIGPAGLDALPAGFKAVASGKDGRSWIAVRRMDHPAVLLPVPYGGADADVFSKDALTWSVLFLNAYRYVSEQSGQLVTIAYVGEDGEELEGVAFESDVAQPIGENPPLTDIQPVANKKPDGPPLWPLLLGLALLMLALERFFDLRSRRVA